jgi:hypothetical protein
MEQYYSDLLGPDEDAINKFWKNYFEMCTMSVPTTGMEIPYEESNLNRVCREFDILDSLR